MFACRFPEKRQGWSDGYANPPFQEVEGGCMVARRWIDASSTEGVVHQHAIVIQKASQALKPQGTKQALSLYGDMHIKIIIILDIDKYV